MSGYIGTQPVPQATQTRDAFTATAGQTSFATGGYTPQFLDVYLNGIFLNNGSDYTAGNGSDVILTSGAAADDILEVVAYTTFEVANITGAEDFTATGTVTAANISDGTDTVETGYVVNGSAKAWVNLNGTGTIAVRDSLNIASVTDIASGNYRYYYTSSFAAADYSVVGSGNANNDQSVAMPQEGQAVLADSVSVVYIVGSYGADAPTACAQMHGDLA